jgi:glycosyltransferase involved in cell wall biosynthesis
MRILFVSPHYPNDFSHGVHGVFQRMRMWLDATRSLNADLEVLFFTRPEAPATPEAAALAARHMADAWGITATVTLCARESARPPATGRIAAYMAEYAFPAFGIHHQPEFRLYSGDRQQRALAQCIERAPDVVLFHRLQATAAANALPSGARRLLDLDDIEYRKFAREIGQPPHWRSKPALYLQVPALWWGERSQIVRSEVAFVCSEADRRSLQRTMRVRNVVVVPNAVSVAHNPRGPSLEPNVLFIGAFSYRPNVVAAEYLIREVWPILRKHRPESRLLIAGPLCESLPSFDAPPAGVEFLGFVKDLDALYARTRVACTPIFSGGGTRIKILEAAGRGVPVVSTPLGAEGLDLLSESEIVIRSGARELADACGQLLSDHDRAAAVGAAARERVRGQYDREAVLDRMRTALVGGGPIELNRVSMTGRTTSSTA